MAEFLAFISSRVIPRVYLFYRTMQRYFFSMCRIYKFIPDLTNNFCFVSERVGQKKIGTIWTAPNNFGPCRSLISVYKMQLYRLIPFQPNNLLSKLKRSFWVSARVDFLFVFAQCNCRVFL